MIPFVKMHGIGNDYVYVDARKLHRDDWSELAVRMSAPHFGCVSDGLILVLESDKADFGFRMFNNDGSESAMCGNGLRCVARLCHDMGWTDKTEFSIDTPAGIKHVRLTLNAKGETELVRADMGKPELRGECIPSAVSGCPVIGHRITALGKEYAFTLVNMGNPHAVCFVDDPDTEPVQEAGRFVECHPDFPQKTNVEFVRVLSRNHIRMRVWERGTGETLACGTGACAAAVACVLNGFCERKIQVDLPGGSLWIEWNEEGGPVYQEGPASFVYMGNWLEEDDRPC